MIKGKSLVMLFSDLLPTTDDWKAEADAMIRSLYRLRYSGHEVIVFHILDELEAKFPLAGLVDFEDVESDGAQGDRRARASADDYLRVRGRVPRPTTRPSAPPRTSTTCRWTRASASTRRCWTTSSCGSGGLGKSERCERESLASSCLPAHTHPALLRQIDADDFLVVADEGFLVGVGRGTPDDLAAEGGVRSGR